MQRKRAATGAGRTIADRARAAAGRPHDHVLGHIRAHGPMTAEDLARATGIGAIMRVIFELEDEGKIIRRGELVACARRYVRGGGVLFVVPGGRQQDASR